MEMRRTFLHLVALSVFFFGCERSDKPESSKINMRMPSSEAIQSLATSQKLQGTAPASMAEINCFAVIVTGPEPELRRNSCFQDSAPTTTQFPVGMARVGIKPNEEISIFVPPGQDRVVSLVGFKVDAGNCFDWKASNFNPDNVASAGFILGTVGRLNLEPGGVKEVPMQLAFNSSKWFDRCQGPDFNDGGSGGGGTTPTANPILTIKKPNWPQQYMVRSTGSPCNEFEVSLRDTNGNLASLPSGQTLTVNLSALGLDATFAPITAPLKIYSNAATCTANVGGDISQLTFDPNISKKTVFVYGGSYIASSPNFKLSATAVNNGVINATNGIWQKEVKLDTQYSYEFEVIRSAVINGCYKGSVSVRRFDGSLTSDSGSFGTTTGLNLYTGADCAIPLTGFSGSNKSFYFKIDNTVIGSPTLSVFGAGLSNSTSIAVAPGTPAAVGVKVLGYNSVPVNTLCGPDSQLRVVLVNHEGSAVPSVSGTEINYVVSYSTSALTLKADSCGGASITNGTNFVLSAGTTEMSMYYIPGPSAYNGPIVLQPNQSLPQLNFNFSIY